MGILDYICQVYSHGPVCSALVKAGAFAVPNELVVFTLGDQRYGLPLSAVDRVIRAVDVTQLPEPPDIVLGVISVQGRVIPVINLQRRFHLPEREIAPGDQMMIAHTARRALCIVVDAVTGVLEYSPQQSAEAREVLPDLRYVDGVVKLADGLILIHDLDTFLSLEEETALDRAMESG